MFTEDFCLKTGAGFAATFTLTGSTSMQQGFCQCCKNISLQILFISGFDIVKQSYNLFVFTRKKLLFFYFFLWPKHNDLKD